MIAPDSSHSVQAIRDSLVVVRHGAAHAIDWGYITLRDYVGWLVTALGIAVATVVTMWGWRKSLATALASQDRSQALRDARDLAVIEEVLREALMRVPIALQMFLEPFQERIPVPRKAIAALDVELEGWRRNWEKSFLMKDVGLRRDIVTWFSKAERLRAVLEVHVDVAVYEPVAAKAGASDDVRHAAGDARTLIDRSLTLCDRMGFDRPKLAHTESTSAEPTPQEGNGGCL